MAARLARLRQLGKRRAPPLHARGSAVRSASMRMFARGLVALFTLSAAGPVIAQPVMRSAPVAVPPVHAVPDAVDTPYPGGPITLDVDATDTRRGAFRVTETIPV